MRAVSASAIVRGGGGKMVIASSAAEKSGGRNGVDVRETVIVN